MSVALTTAVPVPFQSPQGDGAVLSAADAGNISPQSFFAESHGALAEAVVGKGGRGSAWFVKLEAGEAVLRHYRRGGWAAKLSERSYLWLGEAKVRSFAEFALLSRLREMGLPVPRPLAAAYWRSGLTYRAAILVERIHPAQSLASLRAQPASHPAWAAAGRCIGTFHRAGLNHADLNATNVLVDGKGKVWLIDLDRGRLESAPGAWCDVNLRRLQRSFEKLGGVDGSWREGYERLEMAYRDARTSS